MSSRIVACVNYRNGSEHHGFDVERAVSSAGVLAFATRRIECAQQTIAGVNKRQLPAITLHCYTHAVTSYNFIIVRVAFRELRKL